MEQRPLGSTGIWVSEQCLGAMMFGALGNRDHDECTRIVHRALAAGISFLNTADGYSAGESEQILGEALAGGRRAEVDAPIDCQAVSTRSSCWLAGCRAV